MLQSCEMGLLHPMTLVYERELYEARRVFATLL